MGAFTGPLSTTELDFDWRLFRLIVALGYRPSGPKFAGSDGLILAPAGMITDLTSSPQELWSVVPPYGPYSRAAVIHDRLCYLITIGQPHPLVPTYEAAADVLEEAMADGGTSLLQRKLIADAVRAWFEIPNRFRPGDDNPIPCGSVQPVDVVMAHLARRRAA